MSVITEPGVGQPAEQSSDTLLVRLVMSCPDSPGIVAAVSRFLFDVRREHRALGSVLDRSVWWDVLSAYGIQRWRAEGETISQSDSDCRSPNHSE